jgi:predicted nuclease of predicted toxin-antitoxin system
VAVTLYFDHNFSGTIIAQLRRREVDVVTTNDDGTTETDDLRLLDRATALGCVLVTGDQDFLVEGTRRQREAIPFARVIYCGQNYQASIGARVAELELIARTGEPEDFSDLVWRLPL